MILTWLRSFVRSRYDLGLEIVALRRTHGDKFRQAHAESLSVGQKRVLRAIELCRTAALGGHLGPANDRRGKTAPR